MVDITDENSESNQSTSQPNLRRKQVSAQVAAYIQALRHIAFWPYRKIADAVKLPLTTVYRTAHQYSTPTINKGKRGRPLLLSPEARSKLVELATTSAENRRKPFTEIAYLAGVQASEKTLRTAFATEGYHWRVARKKPFLQKKHIQVCLKYFTSIFFFWLN